MIELSLFVGESLDWNFKVVVTFQTILIIFVVLNSVYMGVCDD